MSGNILTPLEFMNIPGSNAKTTKAYLDLWEAYQNIIRRLSDSEYERFKPQEKHCSRNGCIKSAYYGVTCDECEVK